MRLTIEEKYELIEKIVYKYEIEDWGDADAQEALDEIIDVISHP